MIGESSGVRHEDRGRSVWMWDEAQTSESSGRVHEKRSSIIVRLAKALPLRVPSNLTRFQAPHKVSRIYASEDLSDRVVLLSPGGDVTVMDIDLAAQKGEWRSHNKSPLLTSYMFPRSSAMFLPVHPVALLGTLVLFFSSRGVVHVCVLLIHEDEVTTALDESVPVDGVSNGFFLFLFLLVTG
jgi:hypothetical protein